MMKPFSAVDAPRAEIAAALPVAPPGGDMAVPGAADMAPRLAALAADPLPAARAALALLGDGASRVPALAATAGGDGLYALARRLDAGGDAAAAAAILALLSSLPGGAATGHLGLAVLAVRDARIDLASDLIAPHIDSPDRHPRFCSLAGIIELARGNRAAAQAWLANASRIARRAPAFRDELQLAQRALLLMHLG